MTDDSDTNDDYFIRRLNALLGIVEGRSALNGQAIDELSAVLAAIIEIRHLFPELLDNSTGVGTAPFTVEADGDLLEVSAAASQGDNREAFALARSLSSKLKHAIEFNVGRVPPQDGTDAEVRAAKVDQVARKLQGNDQRLAVAFEEQIYKDMNDSLASVKTAVKEAEGARDLAQTAAGVTGSAALSSYFSGYATTELRSANVFRIATIGSIVIAIVAALAGPYFLPFASPDAMTEWQEVVYRLTVVLGIGALAAYFGRQAGQHRNVYNWARSIQVQLESFPAFAEMADETQRSESFSLFARRVLGAPPERQRDKSGDAQVDTQQIFDLLSLIAKRLPPG